MIRRDAVQFLGGIVLALVLLGWVLRGTDPALLWAQLRTSSAPGLLLAAALNFGHNAFRVWRWRALLEPIRSGVPFRPMFAAVVVGYMTTWIVPGRLGEVVRPLLLSGRENVPLGPCLGTVVADRLADAAAVVVLFTVGVWLTPLGGDALAHVAALRWGALVLSMVVAAGLAGMLAVAVFGAGLIRRLEGRGVVLRKIGRMLVSLSQGARAFRSPGLAARIVVHSLLAWLTIAAATWVGVRAAGVDVSPGAVLVLLPMLVLGVAVPTPGGAGSYHGAMRFGLELFDVAPAEAVGAALLMHALVTLPFIGIGTLLLWTEGISWRDVVAGARRLRTIGDDVEAEGAR